MTRKTTPKPTAPAIAENQKSAQALFGVPIAVQRIAKAAGCQAFKSGRVHRDPLLAWVAEHPEIEAVASQQSNAAELKRLKLKAEVRLLQHRHAAELESVMPAADYHRLTGEMMAIVYREAEQLLAADLYAVFHHRTESRIASMSAESTVKKP